MKKFECNKKGCDQRPCRVEVSDHSNPQQFPCLSFCGPRCCDPSDWTEICEKPPQQKAWGDWVFDLPDCPEWARWAAVDSNGKGHWYEVEPVADTGVSQWVRGKCPHKDEFKRIGNTLFGGVVWTDSLLHRPASLQKDQWVRYADDQYGQFVRKDDTGLYVINTVAGTVTAKGVIPLEVTPWSAEQMRAFVGKVIVTLHGSYIVTHIEDGSNMRDQPIIFAMYGRGRALSANALTSWLALCGGKPCGNIREL